VRESGRLRVLIVDDEKPARNDIARILRKIKSVEIAGEAGDGLEAVRAIENLRPDILLLDIRMPGLDGFQVVEKISGIEEAPAVIFVTAYDTHALKAFEVHAADYILKPVDEKRLAEAIERAARIRRGLEKRPDLDALLEALGDAPRRFALRKNDSLVMVDVEDILYATSSGGEIKIVTKELEGAASCRSLDELQRELPPSVFVRVHRSYLANIKQIHEIKPWFSGSYQMRMSHGKGPVIPLSRGYAKNLRKILKW
jgi:DNA-binding LytR/AlgR family response regulator